MCFRGSSNANNHLVSEFNEIFDDENDFEDLEDTSCIDKVDINEDFKDVTDFDNMETYQESEDVINFVVDDDARCQEENFVDENDSESDDYEICPDRFTFSIQNPDPLCVKLNDLLSRGLISSDCILYKHLNDVVECVYDPFHRYHPDVIEFFNTLQHLGGNASVHMLRGPMFTGYGRGIKNKNYADCRMNFAGPSEPTRKKKLCGYTTKSGVIKELSLAHYKLTEGKDDTYLFSNKTIKVIPCVLSNDGNPLKPAIEFDNHLKRNVGLDIVVDYDFIQKNPSPSSELLKNHIVTEVVVSSLTTIDNKTSLPVIAEYVPKSGKTGQNLFNTFKDNIILLQTCEKCQKHAGSEEHIISNKSIRCDSECNGCIQNRKVCDECHLAGHEHYLPCLRACKTCLAMNEICVRRIILVFTSDCEEGNKKAFKLIIDEIACKKIDPHLSLLTVLPDAIHVGKSLKQAFSNWMLVLGNERGFLGLLRALRGRSSLNISKEVHLLIPKSDHVMNRDRMDPAAVISITKNDVTNYLRKIGYISATIIPEISKFTNDNRVGFYPKPIDVCVGPFGTILVLYNFDDQSGTSSLLSARLHCPVDNIKVLKRSIKASQISYDDGVAYLCGNGTKILAIEIVKEKIRLINKKRRKADLEDLLTRFGVSKLGATTVAMKITLDNYLQDTQMYYNKNNIDTNFIQIDGECLFESICPIPEVKSILAASTSLKSVSRLELIFDGVGIKSSMKHCFYYGEGWGKVQSLCIKSSRIYISHREGISIADPVDNGYKVHQELRNSVSFNAFQSISYKGGILISDIVNRKIWYHDSSKQGSLDLFAGNGNSMHKEGPVTSSSFSKPCGLAVEFDNIVYVCDADADRINIITNLKETSNLLENIGNIYRAFSVHEKGQHYEKVEIDDANLYVKSTLNYLRDTELNIRQTTNQKLPSSLNGNHGFVASKTVQSVNIISSGLHRLQKIREEFHYDDIHLLSCLTIDVEHFHAATHFKSVTMSMQQYCPQFASTLRESIKRVTKWGAHYFTGGASWYPTPDNTPNLADVPLIIKGPSVKMDNCKVEEMRTWAHVFGRAVRQKSNRQQTTMASAGTMPSYIYEQAEKKNNSSVNLLYQNEQDNEQDNESNGESDDEVNGEVCDGYDSSSSSSSRSTTSTTEDYDMEEDCDIVDQFKELSVAKETIFLIGGRTRYGRSVRLNSKFL